MKVVFGFFLAFSIGIVCRVAFIPVPAPQALIGAIVVLAMTLGYILTDRIIARRKTKNNSRDDELSSEAKEALT